MTDSSPFVAVNPASGRFSLNGKPYSFMGANLWYGMSLGSAGTGGDRQRLVRELDALVETGVTNLRIMAASEGPDSEPWRVVPALQPEPGKYDEDQLVGLDFLLSEMQSRGMKAVICLGNMWQWSGGFAAYVAWVDGQEPIPYPEHSNEADAWDKLQRYASRFYTLDAAKQLYRDHVTAIVSRKNSLTKVAYRDDPTIMAWQLANEPRGHEHGDAYFEWVKDSAALIKSLDDNHMVSVGSEGQTPWPKTVNTRFQDVHELDDIDYTTLHLWVQNWMWFEPEKGRESLDAALKQKVTPYLTDHIQMASELRKPLVLEEFGISRDGGSCDPAASHELRDVYYRHIFGVLAQHVANESCLSGVNFWSWSGEGRPSSAGADWALGADYTGDPPHEPQGWYGVYDKDEATRALIRQYAEAINSKA